MVKDPWLVWYTQRERILTPVERDAIIMKLKSTKQRRRMQWKSMRFWLNTEKSGQ